VPSLKKKFNDKALLKLETQFSNVSCKCFHCKLLVQTLNLKNENLDGFVLHSLKENSTICF